MESNELLSKVLAENIEKVSGGVGAAIDFTMEQAPEVIQQALMWNLAYNLITFIISVITMMLIIPIAVNFYKKAPSAFSANLDKGMGLAMLSGFPSAALFIIASININLVWLKIWIAPKVWLIEYAAALVK